MSDSRFNPETNSSIPFTQQGKKMTNRKLTNREIGAIKDELEQGRRMLNMLRETHVALTSSGKSGVLTASTVTLATMNFQTVANTCGLEPIKVYGDMIAQIAELHNRYQDLCWKIEAAIRNGEKFLVNEVTKTKAK